MKDPRKNERRYFDALKTITRHVSIKRMSVTRLEYSLALEYAYEGVIEEARRAIAGRRRPAPPTTKEPK